MNRRGWLLPLLLLTLTACQTAGGNGASTTLESARLEAKAKSDAEAARGPAPADEKKAGVPGETRADAPVRPRSGAPSGGDPIVDAVERVGRLQKAQGTLAAMDTVFQCYEKARDPRAPMLLAKTCAAQDFAVSKSVEEGRARRVGGQADVRASIIARRVAQRIGALMQLKGMGQAEFNRFGLYLHQVVKPAHMRAMS